MSRLTDPHDRSTAILFGDGAGAVLIDRVAGRGQLVAWELDSDGSGLAALHAELGGTITMVGREVFRRAVQLFVDVAERTVRAAGATVADISLVVPHQANRRIIEAACDRLQLPIERAVIALEHTANTGAASVPLAMVAALGDGRLCAGDLVLVLGFGAGMTAAAALIRWA